jgi:hypothetical protein
MMDEYIDAVEAEVERLTKAAEADARNRRALWMALWMVRDAIEEVGPVGLLPSVEHEGVEPERIAEHFVAAISRIAALAGEGGEG